MICFHNKYNLGDWHNIDHQKYTGWAHMGQQLKKQFDAAAILPIFLYDHGGLTMATAPFYCQWDSGQVGFILVSKHDAAKHFGVTYCTKKIRNAARAILTAEVEEYNNYLNGDDNDTDDE